jgi:hypothetical protein
MWILEFLVNAIFGRAPAAVFWTVMGACLVAAVIAVLVRTS